MTEGTAIRRRTGGATVRERADLHNAAVDLRSAEGGRCGNIHLASGRVCRRLARHAGSCDFRFREGPPGP